VNPADVLADIEERRLAKIAELGADSCRVCGYDNVFKLVKHHPGGRAASPDYWEVWCVYCHEGYDPWSGDPRKQVSRPSARVRLQRMIEGAMATRAGEMHELDVIRRELDAEAHKDEP